MHVLVIGGGPGGYVAAIRAAQLGADVTLVEQDRLGGTCLNVGCIPTKALLHSAELLEEARHAGDYGVVIPEARVDFEKVMAKKNAVVKQLVAGVTGLMAANRIKVMKGTATFTGQKQVAVGGETLTPDKIIIAAGSVPARPPIPGLDLPQCIDSTGALSLEAIPASMAIIGGGVIGVEMATAYAAFGTTVTIIEMLDEILPMMDRELTKTVRSGLEKKGVVIKTATKVLSVEDRDGQAVVHIENSAGPAEVTADRVLVSVGRKINTESLDLHAAGINHDRGRILVNERMETTTPGIYAIGDCTGGAMLAHVASAQGEVAAENALGHPAVYDSRTNPSCVYTNPEFAGVGLTEEKAKEQGLDYVVGRFPLMANGKSLIMGGGGMVKIIAGTIDGEILGFHMVGPRATDLVTEGALAIGVEATLDEIIATIHAHPTVGEASREAALAALHRAIHVPNR
ncbi:MAG: dihydrolipoyl dehydrogenase [Planctomycetes bacterium]|nr:dihydrolipoyl dehydrogenase [Planctomycetota bacterium]